VLSSFTCVRNAGRASKKITLSFTKLSGLFNRAGARGNAVTSGAVF